jgi:hypothetical protein
MNNKKLFCKTNKLGFVLSAAFLTTLTGCVGYVDGPRAGVYVAPPVVETSVVVVDDYVYYPDYEIYYSSSRRQYYWPEGGAWVVRPAPRGVTVDVLFASPSVRMNFHDAPANHHAEIIRQYPKNSKNSTPPANNQSQKEDRKDNQRDKQRDNHGR